DSYTLAARTVAGESDTVNDTSGTDSLNFSSFTDSVTVNLQTAGLQVVDSTGGLNYKVNLQGTFESVTGGSGNDTLTGNASLATSLNGGAWNDTLTVVMENDGLPGGTRFFPTRRSSDLDSHTLAARTVTGESDTVNDTSGTDSLNFSTFTDSLTV